MASQGGANGKVIVGAVVAVLGAAVGIGQVYLPYFSPQSEIRRDGNSLGKEAKVSYTKTSYTTRRVICQREN